MSRLSTMDSFYRFYKGRQVTRCVMAAVALMALVAASYSPPAAVGQSGRAARASCGW